MDAISPEPTAVPSSPPTYSNPSNSDLAAVAATVSVVGVFMAVLVTWLVLRLRRVSQSQSQTLPVSQRRPTSNASFAFRPSFAPSEASSKFGFIRKPLRLSHRRDGSWDFADPDPFSHPKESSLDPPLPSPSPRRRPAPLSPVPAYTPRAHRTSTHKDELGPRTPTTPGTPASMDFIEHPPPAYCRDSSLWPLSQSKVPLPS